MGRLERSSVVSFWLASTTPSPIARSTSTQHTDELDDYPLSGGTRPHRANCAWVTFSAFIGLGYNSHHTTSPFLGHG